MQSREFSGQHPLQSRSAKERKLFQGPISDHEDQTEVGDLVYVTAADFPAGEYRVVAITYRKCCKSFVLDNGATVYCSQTKPVFQKFVPTDEDRNLGKYAMVFEKRTASGEWDISSTAHIVPLFGKNHLLHKSCWCGPTAEMDEEGVEFFVHAASQ